MRTLVLLLLATTASADTLGDLKASVARLAALQPLRATYVHDTSDTANGKKTDRHIAIEALHDANVVRIEIPRAMIEKDINVSPVSVAHALDYSDTFLEMLNRATVQEEKRVTWGGAPARLLVLKMAPPPPKPNSVTFGSVKYSENRMHVWVGADNLPLAAEHVQKASAGFLMVKGESASKRTWQFTHKDDHLVVARYEESNSFSGLGQKGDLHAIDTVTIH
jgi:hypothetical protein